MQRRRTYPEEDIKGNAEADRLAKLAVKQHRVDAAEVRYWNEQCSSAKAAAMWIARATWAANNCEDAPFKDSEASRWRADLHKKDAHIRKASLKLKQLRDRRGEGTNVRGPCP